MERGASHVRFSDYRDSNMQSETARFFDCASPQIDPGLEPVVAGSIRRAPQGSIAIQLELVPSGSLHTNITGMSEQSAPAKTFGVSGSFDYFVWLSWRLDPILA